MNKNNPVDMVFNKDALAMARYLLARGRDIKTVTAMICGEMPWINGIDVYALVTFAKEQASLKKS